MLNSQTPYNELRKLQDIHLDITPELENACRSCWNSLYHLHGFIDAYTLQALENELALIQLTDAKYSLDLENQPVSFTRLFEAFSSGHRTSDDISANIFRYIEWHKTTANITIDTLKPSYISQNRKNQNLLRDKKEVNVKSYHTNLTLYTAPNQYSVIRILRDELNFMLRHPADIDGLLAMSLHHYQIRAISPYNELNHHVARAYSQVWIKSLHLDFSFLPIARIISGKREIYQSMMREIANSGNYTAWCLYMVNAMQEAAHYMLRKLKDIQALKRKTLDILEKYTEYKLPAAELLKVLFNRPYIKPLYIIEKLDCHRHTAYAYLSHLVKAGILIEKKSGREKLYLHKSLFDVLSN